MPKKDIEAVKSNLIFARVFVSRDASEQINKLALLEGRNKGRLMGIILERIAAMSKDEPDRLVKMGIITPIAAK